VVEYRRFRNSDPPELLRLWHQAGLGRGAASGFDADILETVVFSQPYFDPHGLILAVIDGQPVGFVHAGFGPNAEETDIDPRTGVICAVMVTPAVRRRGIGRELLRRAEAYLQSRGATSVFAGPAAPYDPFYFGIYGGSQPAGFLLSDPFADPFFRAHGYAEQRRRVIMQRSLQDRGGPGGLRLLAIRRSSKLCGPEVCQTPTWWWSTRPGRLDTLELALLPKSGGTPYACVTVVGLDFYVGTWQERSIGLLDLKVPEDCRRKGYGQAILVEVCRRIREEMISLAEAHADSTDTAALGVLTAAGFTPVDTGIIYRKELGPQVMAATASEQEPTDQAVVAADQISFETVA